MTDAVSPRSQQDTARQQAERHLHMLFRGGLQAGEWIELRCLDCSTEPAGRGPRSFHRSITALVTAAMELQGSWDVFVGVGLRRCPNTLDIRRCPHPERGVDHVSRLPAAWCDLDVRCDDEPTKPHESLDRVLALLEAQQPPPGLIVGSGVGAHAYWVLDQPTHDLERIAGLNRAIRDRLSGDNAIDPARILRLAGTTNRKHGRALPVQLLKTPRND